MGKRRREPKPQFLATSATVSVPTFGARRLDEVQDLWDKVGGPKSDQLLPPSDSRRTSSRHLRRRATSHNPRKRHRYPSDAPEPATVESTSRKAKRRRQLMDGRLPTHLWYAKRFHMAKLWNGWSLPLLHTNRGCGAALRLFGEGKTLKYDASGPTAVVVPCIDRSRFMGFQPELDYQQVLLYQQNGFPVGAVGPVEVIRREGGDFLVVMHPSAVDEVCSALSVESTRILSVNRIELYGHSVWESLRPICNEQSCQPVGSVLQVSSAMQLVVVSETRIDLLLSDAPIARDVWNKLVACCAVGLAERMHMQEGPVFPRDYPDTEQGRAYWRGSDDWKLVRAYWEGGLGRIRTDHHTPTVVEWRDGVVIRGDDLMEPIRRALACWEDPVPESRELARRPRRPVRQGPTRVPPLSVGMRERNRQYCQSLRDNLTLPALVVGRVTIKGKGRLKAGQSLGSGYVTSDGGMAVVWVDRLLEVLLDDRQRVLYRGCKLYVRVEGQHDGLFELL